ncbi:MAG: hypothetical protein OXG92_11760 [Chloroflexi bacterium]|nr:hypothetical protein [Chloroflexota bacterium]MCY3582421.1 hypothetical protein [Chloroflexota bacterium]MCY3717131.1 hypothetical protein [Chloroflexota bacterium]MDE2651038.1 hypothetical protein [Chloroflexota bacterium]MXV93325.1 LppX_LprAFG lipoprotein [Chloroflexota bacterium]
MRYTFPLLILLALISCLPLQAQTPPSAQTMLDSAVAELQAARSFRLSIHQSGAPYPLAITLDGAILIPASLQSAEAQYISPNELHISAALRLFLTVYMDVYALDDRQWISFPSGAPYFLLPAFDGFDVNRLLARGDGIERLAANLQGLAALEMEGAERRQLRARSAGELVSSLLFGFIEPTDDVLIDFWLSADGTFAQIDMLMLETLTTAPDDPSRWHIAFSDYDAPRDFTAPSAD